MASRIQTAFEYKNYLIGSNSIEDPYKISRHHIIPQSILNQINDHGCKNNLSSLFCLTLFDDIEGEFCGNKKPKRNTNDPFLWETGNLFFGPAQAYRTDDSKNDFDNNVVQLLDCLGTDKFGTHLQKAFNSLEAFFQDINDINQSLIIQSDPVLMQEEIDKINADESLDPQDKNYFIDRINDARMCNFYSNDIYCVTAVHNLNLFYKGFCDVKKKPLYDMDFYLKNFWRYDRDEDGKHKFRLLKGDEINCEAINNAALLFESTKINGNADLVASMQGPKTVFLEGEAVVSNHFHKTKTADASSSFILDDSVDARF